MLSIAFSLIVGIAAVQGQESQPCKNDKKGHRPPKVEECVSNLSSVQKKKLESLKNDSRTRMKQITKSQQDLRDSIKTLMEQEGDHSSVLFPMFEREAVLQTEMSKEMYRSKLQIDQILTKEQRTEFHKNMKLRRDKHKGEKPRHPKNVKVVDMRKANN